MPVLKLETYQIPYQVVRSSRAKRMRLEWREKALLVAPQALSNRALLAFLWQQSKWLVKQHKKSLSLSHGQDTLYKNKPKAEAGALIPFMGRTLKIIIDWDACQPAIEITKTNLILRVPDTNPETARQMLDEWLSKMALKFAIHWTQQFEKRLNARPRSVRIKVTRSLWGSCGTHDDIYLNKQLVCFPVSVFKYVVLHECCHLRYRNHGPRFWGLVEKLMPDYKLQERFLRKVVPWGALKS